MKKKRKLHYFKIIAIYLLLSTGLIFLILKYGLTVAVKISVFLQKPQSGSDSSQAENFLPSPQLNSFPEATNSAELIISGFAPPNQEVEVQLNSNDSFVTQTDAEGKFSQELTLTLGDNIIIAFTKEKDTLSSGSNQLNIYYNDIPPLLEITEPAEGTTIKKNPAVEIKGKTDKNCRVYINDHLVITDNEGSFSLLVKLNEGENTFKVVSLDKSQNKSEKQFKLNYRAY